MINSFSVFNPLFVAIIHNLSPSATLGTELQSMTVGIKVFVDKILTEFVGKVKSNLFYSLLYLSLSPRVLLIKGKLVFYL